MNRFDNCTVNSGSDFSGVKVGDRLWLRVGDYEGEVEVVSIELSLLKPIHIKLGNGYYLNCNYGGRAYNDGPQVLFYDKVEITPPPRPKRLVKKTIEVRPYWISVAKQGIGMLVDHPEASGVIWCGPVQSIEILTEE